MLRTANRAALRRYLTHFPLTAAIMLSCLGVSFAQTDYPPELADSYDAINQKSVTATVSFLASDEMAGRDTPSK